MKYESELGQIVTRVNEEIKNFEKQKNGQGSVVLLVGKTGSGKSTLFNFLIGANFKAKQDTEYFELDLQEDSNKFSLMKSGNTSVTKFPKCFYEERHQHLIVDFPGFNDTKGWIDEVVIQSLYNKVTQNTNLKIAYVNSQPLDELENRGVDLQKFLKEVMKGESVNLEKITLLMNRYIGDTDEEDLISEWRDTLQESLKSNVGKIVIQKAVRSEDDFHYFNEEQRNSIWKQLVETPVVNLRPHPLKNRDIITSYLTESINSVLLKTVQELDHSLSTQELTLDLICQLTKKYTLMEELVKKDKSIHQVIVWIDSYLKLIQEIKSILKLQGQFEFNQILFVQIYTFFLDFANEIDGYGQVKSTIDKIEKNCQTTLSNLKNKQEQIQQLQEAEKQKQEAERKKQEAEKQRLETEKQKEEAEKKRQEAEISKQEAEKKASLAQQKAAKEKMEADQRKNSEKVSQQNAYNHNQNIYRTMYDNYKITQSEVQSKINSREEEKRQEENTRKEEEKQNKLKQEKAIMEKRKREAEQKAEEISNKIREQKKQLEQAEELKRKAVEAQEKAQREEYLKAEREKVKTIDFGRIHDKYEQFQENTTLINGIRLGDEIINQVVQELPPITTQEAVAAVVVVAAVAVTAPITVPIIIAASLLS